MVLDCSFPISRFPGESSWCLSSDVFYVKEDILDVNHCLVSLEELFRRNGENPGEEAFYKGGERT